MKKYKRHERTPQLWARTTKNGTIIRFRMLYPNGTSDWTHGAAWERGSGNKTPCWHVVRGLWTYKIKSFKARVRLMRAFDKQFRDTEGQKYKTIFLGNV